MSDRTGALESPSTVRAMFDRIAPRYDLMNRLMTAGRDRAWRDLTARAAVGQGADLVLDVATGTGDLALALRRAGAVRVIGIDFSEEMIRTAVSKCAGDAQVSFRQADAMDLPFPNDHFDACTIGFGLRNLPDYQAGLCEMARVIRPGGRLAVLEITPYTNRFLARPFGFYFGTVVPLIGGVVAGDCNAYRYLPRSAAAFPEARELAEMMLAAGLRPVRWRRLGGGTVALHLGIKPRPLGESR